MKKILIFLTAIFLSIGVFGQDLNYVNFRLMKAAINAINASKADTSLSNLASVAINTHLLPGTDGAVNLGSATYKWGNIFIDSAKVINFNNGDITATHSDNALTFAGGNIVLPSTTSIGDVSSTEIGYVNGVTSAIQTQLNGKADTADAIDISTVALLLGDTLYSSNPSYYTQRQVDSLAATISGTSIEDVRTEIEDSLNVLRPEIRMLVDTIPLFVFGAGSGQLADTAIFSDSTLYGSFYNAGSDTLVITELRCVMVHGVGTDTLGVDINWNATHNHASPTELNTTPLAINSTTTGTVDTSFNNAKIPPGVWVWCDTPYVRPGHKPSYFIAQISGYKIPKY